MKIETRTITYAGLLIAISIILTRFCSVNYPVFGYNAVRFGFGGIPILLSGFILGPWAGASVGAIADIIGALLFPSGPYFPGFTLSSALVGLLPGLFYKQNNKMPSFVAILLIVTMTDVLTSVLMNTFWITLISGTGKGFLVFLIPRAIARIILIPLYSSLLYVIIRYFRIVFANNVSFNDKT